MSEKIIKVGSRKSELALVQTRYVIQQLQLLYPEKKFEICKMTTVGDRVLNISLPKIGEKSLFTKDLEDALNKGVVDFVVHSLKDLPTSLPEGMAIGAILEREDPSDALVLNKKFQGHVLDSLPHGSVIGTSSLRRAAQLSDKYPHLKVCDVRGNLNTRLAKLDAADSPMAGLLLAKAGLHRMGWQHRINQTLNYCSSLYAVGQGALAVECRASDSYIAGLIAPLSHKDTVLQVLAERSFLKKLGGGCSAPVAVSTKIHHNVELSSMILEIRGAVWSLDGKDMIEDTLKVGLEELDAKCDVKQDFATNKKRLKLDDADHDKKSECKQKQEVVEKVVIKPLDRNIAREHIDNDCISLALPIGQDFMGQCPYLEAGHTEIIGKCPYKISEQGDTSSARDHENITNPIPKKLLKNNCPFSDESKQSNIVVDSNKIITSHCGILKQNNITIEVMEKCESLGMQLGDILSKNGALELIKSAQSQIKLSS